MATETKRIFAIAGAIEIILRVTHAIFPHWQVLPLTGLDIGEAGVVLSSAFAISELINNLPPPAAD